MATKKETKSTAKTTNATTEKVKATATKAKADVKKAATTAKKKATTTATKAKKTASKVATALVEETFFEFDGFQVSANEIKERIKEAYKAEGHRVTSIKSLHIYVNANERRAYYVINNNAEGKYIEFYLNP